MSMSFFDEVETTVANTRFLQAVEDSGPIKLTLQPYEELSQMATTLQAEVTMPQLLRPRTIGRYLFKQFLKEPLREKSVKVVDRQILFAFLEAVEEFSTAKTHERAAKGKAIYDIYLKYGGSRQAALSGLPMLHLEMPEAEYDEDEGPETSQALREYDDDDGDGTTTNERRRSRSTTQFMMEQKRTEARGGGGGDSEKKGEVHLHLNANSPTSSSPPNVGSPLSSPLSSPITVTKRTSAITTTTTTEVSTPSSNNNTNTTTTATSTASNQEPPPPPPPPPPPSPSPNEIILASSEVPTEQQQNDGGEASPHVESPPAHKTPPPPPPLPTTTTELSATQEMDTARRNTRAASAARQIIEANDTTTVKEPTTAAGTATQEGEEATTNAPRDGTILTSSTSTSTTSSPVTTTTMTDTTTLEGNKNESSVANPPVAAADTEAKPEAQAVAAQVGGGEAGSEVVSSPAETKMERAPSKGGDAATTSTSSQVKLEDDPAAAIEMKVSTGQPGLRSRMVSMDRPIDEMSFGSLAGLVKRIDNMDAVLNTLIRLLALTPPPADVFLPITDAFARVLQADQMTEDFLASPQWKRYVQLRAYIKKRMTLDNFRIFRVLGRGAFGAVSAVQKIDSHAIFAMKEMAKRQVKHQQSEWVCVNERKVLAKMKSPFVLNLKYSFHNSENLYLIFDMCSGGDLKFHLRNEKMRCFSLERARFYAAEVLLGLEHIHSLNIVYRDLKPTNILLDEEGH